MRLVSKSTGRIGHMNTLFIATMALTGPININTNIDSVLIETSISRINEVHRAAFAAFDGPSRALALGSGDSLGCELFSIELVARTGSVPQATFALAE